MLLSSTPQYCNGPFPGLCFSLTAACYAAEQQTCQCGTCMTLIPSVMKFTLAIDHHLPTGKLIEPHHRVSATENSTPVGFKPGLVQYMGLHAQQYTVHSPINPDTRVLLCKLHCPTCPSTMYSCTWYIHKQCDKKRLYGHTWPLKTSMYSTALFCSPAIFMSSTLRTVLTQPVRIVFHI